MLMRFALDLDPPMRRDDPTAGMKKVQCSGRWLPCMGGADIASFRGGAPGGSRAGSRWRCCFSPRSGALTLFTWAGSTSGRWPYLSEAAENWRALWIPSIGICSRSSTPPRAKMTFLVTAAGKPFSGGRFRELVWRLLPRGRHIRWFQCARPEEGCGAPAGRSGVHLEADNGVTGHRSLWRWSGTRSLTEQVILARPGYRDLGTNSEQAAV